MGATLSLLTVAVMLQPAAALIKEKPIEEVIVTGTRTPVPASEFAGPVSVITADDIAARQLVRVIDALKSLPGVAVASGGGAGGQTQLRLRGSEANHVLVIIDGVEVNDPAGGDEFQFEHLSTTEIERIELIRGPLSTAWGSDAVAGVINITTKKGGDTRFNVHSEAGSYGTYSVGGSVQTSGDGWHFNAGADWRDISGFTAQVPGREDDGYENLSLNVRTGGQITPRFSLEASLRYEDTENELDGFNLTGPVGDADYVSFTEKLTAGLTGDINVIDGVWQQKLRVTYLDTDLENLAFGAPNGRTASDKLGLYSDTVLTLDEDHRLTLIADYEETDFTQEGEATFFGDPNQEQSRDNTGIGFDYVGELVGDLYANASVRRDFSSGFQDFTSWRFGLSAGIPDAGARLFASVARGQKAPTFSEQFGFFNGNFIGNQNLTPERSTQWEVGLELAPSEGLSVAATLFFARLTNEINSFVALPGGLFTAENVDGRSKRSGVEVTFDASLSDTLSLKGHYTYVRSTAPAFEGSDVRVRELRRPRHQAAILTAWQATDAFSINLDLDYTGRAADTRFLDVPPFSEAVTLDDYFLVRLAASYQLNAHITLTARVENLLDEAYQDVVDFNTAGASAYAGVRINF